MMKLRGCNKCPLHLQILLNVMFFPCHSSLNSHVIPNRYGIYFSEHKRMWCQGGLLLYKISDHMITALLGWHFSKLTATLFDANWTRILTRNGLLGSHIHQKESWNVKRDEASWHLTFTFSHASFSLTRTFCYSSTTYILIHVTGCHSRLGVYVISCGKQPHT
jgi:hypothetical protein